MAKLGAFCFAKRDGVGFSFATLARLCLALKVGKKRKK
ncbi:hypothetical protein CUP1184 [Campylobacter upsaliensis RM3195]|nr:hypothetical protein CUP1184 [Campylobacter upsaliensis RM3195]